MSDKNEEQLDHDLDNLSDRIRAAKGIKDEPEIKSRKDNYAHYNIAMEFLGTILASVFIGYWLDRWLETQPIMLLIFIFAGFASAFLNIYKQSQNMGSSVGFSGLPSDKKSDKTISNFDKEDKIKEED